jgi:hypothetical protein
MALIGYIGRSQRRKAQVPMSMRNAEEELNRYEAGLPSAVPRTPQGELHEALRDHLYRELASTPPSERRHARWVMNAEWLEEVHLLSLAMGEPPPGAGDGEETILGKPVDVRADGGVPHLEPGTVP